MSDLTCQWLPLGRGRLTLCHRPGSRAIAQLVQFGCTRVLTLLSEREGAPGVGAQIQNQGLQWTWLPMRDGKPPQADTAQAIRNLLPILSGWLDEGESILIHCAAGIHRTGMVSYALLRWRGYSDPEALDLLAQMRPQTREGLQLRQIRWANRTVAELLNLGSAPQDRPPPAQPLVTSHTTKGNILG